MSWVYVPGLEVLNSASDLPSLPPAWSVTWRGKSTPSPSRSPAFRTVLQTMLRCGMTFAPSTAARGVAVWIAFLLGSRVSRSQSPASDGEPPTSGGCGQTSRESFAAWDRDSSSWRIPQASFLAGLDTYSETWPRSGSMRNGMCALRPRAEPPISGVGSSYLPTPRASDHFLGVRGRLRRYWNLADWLANMCDSGKLNPSLPEWMMGWPSGWTALEPVATESFRRWRRSHGELLGGS